MRVPSLQGRSLVGDFEGKGLTEEIEQCADSIYRSMKCGVHRGKKRIQLSFYCAYQAHRELSIIVDPLLLGRRFGLTDGDVQKSLSLFSFLQTGYRPIVKRATPLEFVTLFCLDLPLTATMVGEIQMLTERILNSDPALEEQLPQAVAAAVIRYYMITNGVNYTQNITTRSEMTIDALYKQIATADNRT